MGKIILIIIFIIMKMLFLNANCSKAVAKTDLVKQEELDSKKKFIDQLVQQSNPEIVALAEAERLLNEEQQIRYHFLDQKHTLNRDYVKVSTGDTKIEIWSRKDVSYEMLSIEEKRSPILKIDGKWVIAFVHLIDMINYTSEQRQSFAQRVATEIRKYEVNHPVVILGDFNMNPWESGMRQEACFNAVFRQEDFTRDGTRTFQGKIYSQFFNPTFGLLSDQTITKENETIIIQNSETPGIHTYNNKKGIKGVIDFVLLNKEAFAYYKNVRILDTSFKHSDHAPILLELTDQEELRFTPER